MGKTTILNRTRAAWAIVATGCLLAGGCNAPSRTNSANASQCVGESLQVRWPPGRLIDMRFATVNAAGFENSMHYCIGFEEDEQQGEYHVLCGIENSGDAGAKFFLTPKNETEGQPPEPGPRGPGMRHNVGWSFITFRWPLIWVRNIDAGSIGTTAIMRWQGEELTIFLVRNGKETPTSGDAQPDMQSKLLLRAGYPHLSTNLCMPDGKEIVRVRLYQQGGVSDNMVPVYSSPETWEKLSFNVTGNATGPIVVTATEPAGDADCAFLAGVLQLARDKQIYRLPGEPVPVPQPEPTP